MKAFRYISIVLALLLIAGEAYRSWGAGRPIAAWMDDVLAGSLIIIAAVLLGKETWARRALFTGAWGVCAGMLYSSFFSKIYDPANVNAGNFNLGVLTALVGLAFGVSVIGFIASLMLPFRPAS